MAPATALDAEGFEFVRVLDDDTIDSDVVSELLWLQAANFSAFFHTEVEYQPEERCDCLYCGCCCRSG